MTYEEFPPPPVLADRITCFWRFALPPGESNPLIHVVPPDATVSIVWRPQPNHVAVIGPRMDALRVQVWPGEEYHGLRLRPGAVAATLGIRAPELRGKNIPLNVCAPHLPRLAGHASPEALAELVQTWPDAGDPPDPRAMAWIQRLIDDPHASVAALAAESGLSYRHMLRLFYEVAGLTPKEFARLRKIRLACIQAVEPEPANWARISAESGFADQPHLTREVSEVFGWTPRLLQEYLRRIDHRNVVVR